LKFRRPPPQGVYSGSARKFYRKKQISKLHPIQKEFLEEHVFNDGFVMRDKVAAKLMQDKFKNELRPDTGTPTMALPQGALSSIMADKKKKTKRKKIGEQFAVEEGKKKAEKLKTKTKQNNKKPKTETKSKSKPRETDNKRDYEDEEEEDDEADEEEEEEDEEEEEVVVETNNNKRKKPSKTKSKK